MNPPNPGSLNPEPSSELLRRLDAFSAKDREQTLRALAAPAAFPPEGGNVNMHAHSFYSYNASGASPSRLAFEGRRAGLRAMGLCDFDVLDGLEEFLRAGRILGLRATVNLETRAFLREYGSVEINSPGEPGVVYIMGAGFARAPAPTSPEGRTLTAWRRQAGARNTELIGRINPHVPEIAIGLERDVLPLTPSGAATERHIVRAYCRKAAVVFADDCGAAFWARVLGLEPAAAAALLRDVPALEEKVRSRLAKKGGFGYEQPTEKSFPPAGDFIAWCRACGALPMITWLDGTSAGEADPKALCECLAAKGCVAVNIVPDRNWNLKDPAAAALKQRKLKEFVELAEALHLPVNIGTELNKDGLPFVDDLAGAALKPHAAVFRRGADILVGHTVLLRHAGFGYVGEAAAARFGADRAAQNRFFEAVGRLPALTEARAAELDAMGPERALGAIENSLK
ncbi:MAG: hypothetical protein R6X19_08735 [Kiritimatiellia bacterium]